MKDRMHYLTGVYYFCGELEKEVPHDLLEWKTYLIADFVRMLEWELWKRYAETTYNR